MNISTVHPCGNMNSSAIWTLKLYPVFIHFVDDFFFSPIYAQLGINIFGLVQGWAAVVMGVLSGSIPWFSMMILHKKSTFLQQVDDTLAVLHTHAVAGLLGGILTGLLAEPTLCGLILPVKNSRGAFYGHGGGVQLLKQLVGALFVIGWNIVSTTAILLVIRLFIPLRMPDEELIIGDDAAHGEEAYALWGDGEKYDPTKHGLPNCEETTPTRLTNGARGVTIQL